MTSICLLFMLLLDDYMLQSSIVATVLVGMKLRLASTTLSVHSLPKKAGDYAALRLRLGSWGIECTLGSIAFGRVTLARSRTDALASRCFTTQGDEDQR
jgi:hypothetical protein